MFPKNIKVDIRLTGAEEMLALQKLSYFCKDVSFKLLLNFLRFGVKGKRKCASGITNITTIIFLKLH